MLLAGVDLAWQSEKNSTAAAVGLLEAGAVNLVDTAADLRSLTDIKAMLERFPNLTGVAIDAPLIIRNWQGQRECEKQIASAYGSRKASCHTSSLTRYPDPASVRLSIHLSRAGFGHLECSGNKWQIECYPHPAIIEIFGLPERLAYKKGKVATKRAGQKKLSKHILSLTRSGILPLNLNPDLRDPLDPDYIDSLKGRALKQNEDLLDSVICLYIAGLYAVGADHAVYGDVRGGYIYVPQQRCI